MEDTQHSNKIKMIFSLTKEQKQKFNTWFKQIKKEKPKKSQKVKFIFSTTGGIGVTIFAKVGKEKINLTEYNNW